VVKGQKSKYIFAYYFQKLDYDMTKFKARDLLMGMEVEDQRKVIGTLFLSIFDLHDWGYVISDLKPDNIMIIEN